jgi:ribonuclease HI
MAGRFLGEVSNNVAEYDGLQLALGHAILHPAPLMRFRVDSMLIAKQVTFKWRCLAPSLVTPYEETLALLRRLRSLDNVSEVVVEHVYREYDADADGVCSRVMDMQTTPATADSYGLLVNVAWCP